MNKLTALVALLTMSIAAFSNGENDNASRTENKIAIVQKVDQKFKIVYVDKTQGTVDINISNANGEIVHRQKISNQHGFSQLYDFQSLPEGDYIFNITNPDGTKMTKTIAYKKKLAQSDLRANVIDINDKNRFRLAVLKNNTKPVTVKIYRGQNQLIHSETINSSESFSKVFDLGSIDAEDIWFEVRNNRDRLSLVAN